MRILDTKRAKERRETKAADERELREYEEWLNSGSTVPLGAGDLKGIWNLWDGHGGSSTSSPADLKKLAESLRKQLGIA